MPLTIRTVSVTIANGASLSSAAHIGGGLVKIIMPAEWDAAALTFQHAGYDGATFQDLYDTAGSELSVTEPSGGFADVTVHMKAAEWLIFGQLKVRSGTSAAAVNQTPARTIQLVYRDFQ